ncbi:MAG: CbiX/SirB N-terminal domain-containing protein [Phototrophicaceae bacterium]
MAAKTALILVGHGSHISPNTAGFVWRYVDQLRAMGVADEITACFWKEQPSFADVLRSVTAPDVTIIPVFTAQGFYTREVIPAEMGLTGALTVRDGKTIRYGKTLGEHPDINVIVRQRVQTALAQHKLDPAQTTVALIAHGTKRHPDSRNATREQVAKLQAANLVHAVIEGYLDDAPDIPSIYERAPTPYILAVPFFLTPGSHVTIDVPEALGLGSAWYREFNGKALHYTDPIGTDSVITAMILDLAEAAGMPEADYIPNDWTGFPLGGRDVLLDTLQRDGQVIFGELMVFPEAIFPASAIASGDYGLPLHKPSVIRYLLRVDPFRPLASGLDLPEGWHVELQTPEQAHAVLETVYPGAVADWALSQQGKFQPNTFEAVIARQVGDYRALAALSGEQVAARVETVCSRCCKHPTWHSPHDAAAIPCAEPCNVWLSFE